MRLHAISEIKSIPLGRNERVATRIIFFVAGFSMSAWAPLVPYAKARLAVDDATLGVLLLCLGAGSIIIRPLAGILVGRFGCRVVIMIAGAVLCLTLPFLAIVSTEVSLGLTLLVFGAASGTIDIAMNAQAVIVEKANGSPLMSGFHGLFSVGGIAGAGGVSMLLGFGMPPFVAVIGVSLILAVLLAGARTQLLVYGNDGERQAPLFVLPRGTVIFVGLLCFILFLAEAAMLDWSALFLTSLRDFDPAQAGMGYAAFAIAMRSEEHTSELQSHSDLVCRLLLEKKKKETYDKSLHPQ